MNAQAAAHGPNNVDHPLIDMLNLLRGLIGLGQVLDNLILEFINMTRVG